jgi:hypothetical protein
MSVNYGNTSVRRTIVKGQTISGHCSVCDTFGELAGNDQELPGTGAVGKCCLDAVMIADRLLNHPKTGFIRPQK